jgi:hypothetical protein
MKHLAYILTSLFVGMTVQAAPLLRYTFSGEVSSLTYDGGNVISHQGVLLGDPVSAVIDIDFGADGYFLLNDGSIEIAEDPPITNSPHWYFFTALVDATLLPELNGGLNNRLTDVQEYHVGWFNSYPGGNTGILFGGTGDSYVTIQKSSGTDAARVENWIIGESLQGTFVAYSDVDWSFLHADMTLDSVVVIPEPSPISALLLSASLFVLMLPLKSMIVRSKSKGLTVKGAAEARHEPSDCTHC